MSRGKPKRQSLDGLRFPYAKMWENDRSWPIVSAKERDLRDRFLLQCGISLYAFSRLGLAPLRHAIAATHGSHVALLIPQKRLNALYVVLGTGGFQQEPVAIAV